MLKYFYENHAYSDKNLEEFLQKHFGVNFGIEEVISRNLSVGYSAEATIFKSKKRLYAFISLVKSLRVPLFGFHNESGYKHLL